MANVSPILAIASKSIAIFWLFFDWWLFPNIANFIYRLILLIGEYRLFLCKIATNIAQK